MTHVVPSKPPHTVIESDSGRGVVLLNKARARQGRKGSRARASDVTSHDKQQRVTCLRPLDAEADGADWRATALPLAKRLPTSVHFSTERCCGP